MSFHSTFLNVNFRARPQKKDSALIIEMDLSGLVKGLIHALFIGPRLQRQVAPGCHRSPKLYLWQKYSR